MKLLLLCIIVLILLSACTNITQEMAEAKALRFVNDRVKFYTKDNTSAVALPSYTIDSVTSYKVKNKWVVLVHISSIRNNQTKKTDLIVEIHARNGNILTFNNQPVTYR